MRIKNTIPLLITFLPSICCLAQKQPVATIQKQSISHNGAVVSAHPLASAAGIGMFKLGGNAFDAAIATQFALAVVYPAAGNLGGGGFMVAHLKNGKNISIDYRETAPAKSYRDMFLDSNKDPVPNLSLESHLASGIPGSVAGIFATLKYAKLDLKTLITPAIILAEKGFAITELQATELNELKNDFIKFNHKPVAFVKEIEWKAGDILIQPELAATLKRIRDKGMKGFYEGPTAKYIVDEMKAGKGIISYADLKNYKAKERAVLAFNYKQYRIIGMALPSSGGIIVQQLMKMIEHKNIAAMGYHSAAALQLMVEAERRAYADRAAFLGDPGFVKNPVKTLLSDAYLQQRMLDFVPGKAGNSDSTKPGNTKESEQTTHFSIIDKEGNAISVTTTLNDSYGNKRVVAGAGFILNNEMDDFSIKEGLPNMYGLTGNAANAVAPGKRMLSSMSPTIVLKNNQPYLVVGTPGGSTIPTSIFQTLVNILEFNMRPADAVNNPKFHHQWLPDIVEVEEGFPEKILTELTAMGYKIKPRSSFGRIELIEIKQSAKREVIGVGDRRGDDDAEGY